MLRRSGTRRENRAASLAEKKAEQPISTAMARNHGKLLQNQSTGKAFSRHNAIQVKLETMRAIYPFTDHGRQTVLAFAFPFVLLAIFCAPSLAEEPAFKDADPAASTAKAAPGNARSHRIIIR